MNKSRVIKLNRNNDYVVIDSYRSATQVIAKLNEEGNVVIINDFLQKLFAVTKEDSYDRIFFEKTFYGLCQLIYVDFDWQL